MPLSEAPGVLFIFVSGTLGEKRAAEALTRGAAEAAARRFSLRRKCARA